MIPIWRLICLRERSSALTLENLTRRCSRRSVVRTCCRSELLVVLRVSKGLMQSIYVQGYKDGLANFQANMEHRSVTEMRRLLSRRAFK